MCRFIMGIEKKVFFRLVFVILGIMVMLICLSSEIVFDVVVEFEVIIWLS